MKSVHYNQLNGILFVNDDDNVTLNSMLNALQFLEETEYLPENLKILESALTSTITFNETDLPVLVEFAKSKLYRYQSIRHAVVHSNPTNTAFAIIVSEMLAEIDYKLMVFSSEADALLWLNHI